MWFMDMDIKSCTDSGNPPIRRLTTQGNHICISYIGLSLQRQPVGRFAWQHMLYGTCHPTYVTMKRPQIVLHDINLLNVPSSTRKSTCSKMISQHAYHMQHVSPCMRFLLGVSTVEVNGYTFRGSNSVILSPFTKGELLQEKPFFHLSFLYKEIAKTLCGTLTLQTSFVINMYVYSLLSKKTPHVSRKNLFEIKPCSFIVHEWHEMFV